MAAILKSAILNSSIMDSVILVFPLKLTHSCQDWFPPFAQKNFTHSLWLNLMMAAVLNSAMLDWDTAILDSDTLLSSPRFTQKHSHSTLTLNQTNSIWLKLIHSHFTWWWQPSWIWPSWIQPSKFFLSNSLTLAKNFSCHLHKKTSLIHSDSTWWWQASWILSCWIHTLASWIQTLLLSSLRFTQKHSHSTLTLNQTNSIWLKLIHSSLNSMMTAILNLAILVSANLVFSFKLTHTCQDFFLPFAQKNFTHSFWLKLMMSSHLEFCHVGLRDCHLGFRHLVIFSQIHSNTLSLHSDSESN